MEPKTVLVVDDDGALRSATRRLLEDEGYQVLEADSGEKAIHLAKTSTVHLIVLDISLPGKHGMDVADAIKSDPQIEHIPVIFCTGLLQKEAEERFEQQLLGHVFFTKPFDSQKFVAEIAKQIG